jgi:hypothetical protein
LTTANTGIIIKYQLTGFFIIVSCPGSTVFSTQIASHTTGLINHGRTIKRLYKHLANVTLLITTIEKAAVVTAITDINCLFISVASIMEKRVDTSLPFKFFY